MIHKDNKHKTTDNSMTDGERLFVTAHYAFNYDESHYDHLFQFDILTQFFEHRNNLKGFISDEEGDRVEEGSEVAILINDLYEAFDNKNIPKVVNEYLHLFEMYTVLEEYNTPLGPEALQYKEELLKIK